ncbi:hypothetical protein [Clavibacter michiganensis]|uniref:hypothetical protein n=1 Tax=Clavibacter michiganensis TaxID=28447 RepID=UPI000B6408DE|nr:hypothetical protein [Clavibacter michiganensis]MBW8027123.1 hypothetical protein [Clavibacter michiganensis subsp. michiganensis]NIY61801.1 hypothetical protein [Clavibacter michiganensis subsp. michiganensis]OUE11360.1 hypothetical protein CMMCA001_13430 [Clavibacter michiganensis subsp. michiganensis]QXP02792.1 hypothetical protein KN218_14755 [Clavibacter michiganensis subsp. michiganensis]QXP05818.1 hypothetical protein KN200_14830 [Clavibacter michiganensis subsp. michiganensis]
MHEVAFRRYREFVDARVAANNSMIALLAGSRLASHSMQLHAGSPHYLSGLFPRVRDIERFNLSPDMATQLLDDADEHLSAVAIPYALAVYEAFVIDAIAILTRDGHNIDESRGSRSAGRMHTTFYAGAGAMEPVEVTRLFHVLRCMRNAQIHRGGLVTDELRTALEALQEGERSRWEQLTMMPLADQFQGPQIQFHIGHLVASFAITKEAARRINEVLRTHVSRATWALMAAEDYDTESSYPQNSTNWRRAFVGFCRYNYREQLALTRGELEKAARDLQMWTIPEKWS